MGGPAIQSSICDTDEILDLQDLGGTLRFGSESELRNYIENTAARSPRRKVRAFGSSNREINELAKPTLDSCEDNKISNEDLGQSVSTTFWLSERRLSPMSIIL